MVMGQSSWRMGQNTTPKTTPPSTHPYSTSQNSTRRWALALVTLQAAVFCLGRFCRVRRPAPFWCCPTLFKSWNSALPFLPKKNVSHTWILALFCPFCCPHTALIVLCLFYCPFTVLIVPFSSVHRTKCSLFRWHPPLLKTLVTTLSGSCVHWVVATQLYPSIKQTERFIMLLENLESYRIGSL